MKKLIFLFAFTFIGGQAFSQMYIVMVHSISSTTHPSGCVSSWPSDNRVMTTVSPSGVITYTCLVGAGTNYSQAYATAISTINQEFNTIIGQGYKLVATSADANLVVDPVGSWYFAIP